MKRFKASLQEWRTLEKTRKEIIAAFEATKEDISNFSGSLGSFSQEDRDGVLVTIAHTLQSIRAQVLEQKRFIDDFSKRIKFLTVEVEQNGRPW